MTILDSIGNTPLRIASSDEGTLVRCAADPRPHAVRYRNDEFDYWIRRADGTDRTTTLRIAVATPELAELFDGSERLISVHAVPTSLRAVCAA